MKENNRSQKFIKKKNMKKEIKIVNHLLDIKKANKPYATNNLNKNSSIKKPSPKRLEPIKVRLTPINKIIEFKGKKNVKLSNTLYSSPPHGATIDMGTSKKLKVDNKIALTQNRNYSKKEKFNKKKDRNCNTPSRKMLNEKPKDTFSPSTSVIIKNFNYNNVYNINIDNEKEKNKKNNKINNKIKNKSGLKKINSNKNLTNFNENNAEGKNKLSIKNTFSQKFTYNKPKTTSGMNAPKILSKRNKSKDITFIKESYNREQNKPNIKSETVYSRFISEGNTLKNGRNYFHSNLVVSKLENRPTYKFFNRTPYRNKTNNFNMTTKSYIKDCNLPLHEVNNNINNTYTNHFSKNNSCSKLNFRKKEINKFYNTSSLSLNNTFVNNRNILNSPKLNDRYSHKTESVYDQRYYDHDNDYGNDKIQDEGNIEIILNFNDLFIFEDRINDIVSAFNKTNNIYDIEASNECNEFIIFYSKSSLKGVISTFFNDNNKLIIESSINLSLFFICILYHLSINNILFNDLISTINNILSFLKINFALYVKKIQLYYGMDIVKKNFIFFQPFNSFLNNNNIKDFEEEDDITYKIYQNCQMMTNEIKTIMNYYQKIDLNSYEFFMQIFNNISIQKESDILKSFYTKINNVNTSQNLIVVNKSNSNLFNNTLKKNKTNINLGDFTQYKKNFEKIQIYQKSPIRTLKKEKEKEKLNKIEIPYIKTPSDKKYTLILDLNKTLAFYDKNTKSITLRNGLFSFLSMLRPYYEIISFSCEPNEITESIIKEIESQKIYFDYHLTREHSILYENTLVKDISLIGRDSSKVIIVDDDENCFQLNNKNGIKISEFNGNNDIDNSLFELKKILILIYRKNYDDVRIAVKEFANEIKNKVSLV